MKIRSTTWLKITNEIIRSFDSHSDSPEFQHVLNMISIETKADYGFILFIPNDHVESIIPKHLYGITEQNILSFNIKDKRLSNYAIQNASIVKYPQGNEIDDWFYPYDNFKEDIKSELAIPILFESRALGSLTLSFLNEQNFSVSDIKHFEAIGELLGLLYQTKRFKRVSDVLGQTKFSKEDDNLYLTLAQKAKSIAETDIIRVRKLLSPNNLKLVATCGEGIESHIDLKRDEQSFSWGVVDKSKKALQTSNLNDIPTSCSLHIPDLSNWDEKLLYQELHEKHEIKEIICVPIIGDNEVLGVLNAYSRRINAFDKDQENFLTTLANSAGDAIIRSRRLIFKNKLTDKINDISRIESSKGVWSQAKQDFVEFFDFDFSSIYLVDHLKNRIKTEYYSTKNKKLIDPSKWSSLSNYDLNSHDVLSYVIRHKQAVYANGKEVLNELPDEISNGPNFNEKIYDRFDHKDLVRYFFPIIRRKSMEDRVSDQTLGVVELGFHKKTTKSIPKDLRENVALYIDNCAQPYFKNSNNENDKLFEKTLSELFDSHENENDYLVAVLEWISSKIGAQRAEVGFIGFFDKQAWYPAISITHNIDKTELRLRRKESTKEKKKGIYRHVYKEGLDFYFTKDSILNDKYFIPGIDDILSQLSLSIRNKGNPIGVISFYGNEPNMFNEYHAKWVSNLLSRTIASYGKKKTLVALNRLVRPFDFSISPLDVYPQVIDHLTNYFGDCFAAVWERELVNGRTWFRRRASTNILLEKFEKIKFNSYEIEELDKLNSQEIKIIGLSELTEENFEYDGIIDSTGFSSLIFIPINISGEQQIGSIEIYSERKVESISLEESTFLTLLASKAAIYIQNSKMTNQFLETPEFFVHGDLQLTLEKLVRTAFDMIGSNPVVLFTYDETLDQFGEGISAGDFIVSRQNESWKYDDNDILRSVLESEDDWWIENREEYLEYVSGRNYHFNHFDEDFYHRERIESFAAIRLIKDDRHLGVMFFNFRETKKFDGSLTKKLIKTFSGLAAGILDMASTSEFNREIVAKKVEMIKEVVEAEIGSGLTHETGHLVFEIQPSIQKLEKLAEQLPESDLKESLIDEIDIVDSAVENLNINYKRVRSFRKRTDIEIKETVALSDLVNDCYTMLEGKFKKKRIKTTFNLLPDGRKINISCNTNLMTHVVLNLLINAWDAMSNSDRLEMFVLNHQQSDKHVILRIRDHGSGVDDKIKNKIFKPYFTTKRYGTGLGLPMSQYIIEKIHGGKLEFRTEKHRFTQFDIILEKTN